MIGLPYKIGTLLYGFNAGGEVLLLQRSQEPNLGLWSPPGGKLNTSAGESPYTCGCREAAEEMELALTPNDLRLVGLVSEQGYLGQSHWLMFLFEILPSLDRLPRPHREGTFSFFPRNALQHIPLPTTDRERLWPWFWQHRGGFFAAHCDTQTDGTHHWTLLQSEVVSRHP